MNRGRPRLDKVRGRHPHHACRMVSVSDPKRTPPNVHCRDRTDKETIHYTGTTTDHIDISWILLRSRLAPRMTHVPIAITGSRIASVRNKWGKTPATIKGTSHQRNKYQSVDHRAGRKLPRAGSFTDE
jgi:hypothetical protein